MSSVGNQYEPLPLNQPATYYEPGAAKPQQQQQPQYQPSNEVSHVSTYFKPAGAPQQKPSNESHGPEGSTNSNDAFGIHKQRPQYVEKMPTKLGAAMPSPAYKTAPSSPQPSASKETEPLNPGAAQRTDFKVTFQNPISSEREKPHHGFNEHSQKYRCCCNSMHIRTGATAIGAFQLSILMLHFAIQFLVWICGHGYDAMFAYSVAITIISIPVYVLFFIGLGAENGFFFLPWQVMTGLEIFSIALLFFISSYLRLDHQSAWSDREAVGSSIFFGVLFLIALVLITILAWWMIIVIKCQKYFSDKKKPRAP